MALHKNDIAGTSLQIYCEDVNQTMVEAKEAVSTKRCVMIEPMEMKYIDYKYVASYKIHPP